MRGVCGIGGRSRRIAQGVKKEDLLAGLHRALAAQINAWPNDWAWNGKWPWSEAAREMQASLKR